MATPCTIATVAEWNWGNDGYPRKGRSKAQGGTVSAVKYLWELEHGPIEKGYEPDHLCENIRCINLEHIEIVTSAENNARAHRKLTWEEVRNIRRKLAAGVPRTELAADYHVTYMTIKNIQIEKTWKEEV